ncbi:hypothetical protein PoB_004160700 [Plakobranchus ocellatus]|uniref:Uncharacterized protein n=1 Tax=Plakobranchus ocellatus TaxID=259542 RepID=A0AAV4B7F5_9GAST|nr:hypothetical protein PoB_004160700 [Plakobranchus ocellatus]
MVATGSTSCGSREAQLGYVDQEESGRAAMNVSLWPSRKQREGAALSGVVILTDCRALVWALGGSRKEGVGEAMLLADYLLKTEEVRTVVR